MKSNTKLQQKGGVKTNKTRKIIKQLGEHCGDENAMCVRGTRCLTADGKEKKTETSTCQRKDRQEEITDVYRELKKDVEMSEKRLLIEIKSLKNDIGARVGVLEKYRWIIIGGAIVIGWILSKNFMPIMHMMASN